MNKADYPNPSPKGKKSNPPVQTPLANSQVTDITNNPHPKSLSNETAPKNESKESDLFVLAQRLRQRNRLLQDQVVQLQESLRAAEEKLYSQSEQFSAQESIRSQEVGTIISQQNAETSYANEHAGRLLHELENSHQLAQRQQILIETLSAELQTSQERIAQLERECALTQQQYNEQSHELLQSESRCQELNTRLLRQQRQALQFKIALEKSLEVPASNQTSNQTSNQIPELPWQEELEIAHKLNQSALSTRINTQPIQPWSNPEEAESNPLAAIEERPLTAATMPLIFSLPEAPPQEQPHPQLEKLHLNSPEEMMQPLILSLNPAVPRLNPSSESLFDVTEVNSSHFSVNSPAHFAPVPLATQNHSLDISQYLKSLQPEPEMQDISTNDQKLQQLLAVVKRSPYIPPESDEPAPIIYPERPSKKIPSLSAINLPNFPRHRPPEN